MRAIIFTILVIAVFEDLNGSVINKSVLVEEPQESFMTDLHTRQRPQFTEINGSVFLVLNTGMNLNIADGAVVEFIFKGPKKQVTFHVNDANQEIIDQGNADLLMMIHEDLALALKHNLLKKLRIINDGVSYSIKVGAYWQPHLYLAKL